MVHQHRTPEHSGTDLPLTADATRPRTAAAEAGGKPRVGLRGRVGRRITRAIASARNLLMLVVIAISIIASLFLLQGEVIRTVRMVTDRLADEVQTQYHT